MREWSRKSVVLWCISFTVLSLASILCWMFVPWDVLAQRKISEAWTISRKTNIFVLSGLGLTAFAISLGIKCCTQGKVAMRQHVTKHLLEGLIPAAGALLLFVVWNMFYWSPRPPSISAKYERPKDTDTDNLVIVLVVPPVPEFAWPQQPRVRSGAKGHGDHGYVEALLTKISGSWELTVFNEGKDPFDNVGLSIMQSPQGPDGNDIAKITKATQERRSMDIGTLRVHDVRTIGPLPMTLWPDSNKPTMYQIMIYTRYVRFMEWLYASPKNGFVDQGIDVVNIDTNQWYVKQMGEALRRWHNYPEWWK